MDGEANAAAAGLGLTDVARVRRHAKGEYMASKIEPTSRADARPFFVVTHPYYAMRLTCASFPANRFV